MMLDERLLERIARLIVKGDEVKATHYEEPDPALGGFPSLDSGAFAGWRAQVLNFLINLLGSEHTYVVHFAGQVKEAYNSHVDIGQGILLAVKEDVEGGYLTNIRTLISAEVFTDFLEMAEHLHEVGYKDPAASLAGAVLEDGLRRIATTNSVTLKTREDLSSLNRKIADKGVYNRLVQKKIQVWTDVRNHADHGEFHEYSAADVADLINGIEKSLADYL